VDERCGDRKNAETLLCLTVARGGIIFDYSISYGRVPTHSGYQVRSQSLMPAGTALTKDFALVNAIDV